MNSNLNRDACYLRKGQLIYKPKLKGQPRELLEKFKSVNLAKKASRQLNQVVTEEH